VRLFLDTSVILSACASEKGASRELFRKAAVNRWVLVATPYVLEEVLRNLPDFPIAASGEWGRLRREILVMDDVLTLSLPVVFPVTKDRPVIFSALAWADALITLDRGDFTILLGESFYGLAVLSPGQWFERERAAGRLLDS
jgi:predicted nucleic acid-binding protein